jgi:hypothetical protein
VSFDIVQAEGHALVRAASLCLLLALPASAQLVLNYLGGGGAGGRTGTRPSLAPSLPRPLTS